MNLYNLKILATLVLIGEVDISKNILFMVMMQKASLFASLPFLLLV